MKIGKIHRWNKDKETKNRGTPAAELREAPPHPQKKFPQINWKPEKKKKEMMKKKPKNRL